MPAASNRTPKAKILIVDDNEMGLIARKGVLMEQGHEVVTSHDPHEALALCAQEKFEVVITDFKMQEMSGIEFIRRLRVLHAAVPVILVSGFTDTLGLCAANTGADAVIQKSSNEVAHLIRAVNRLLKKPAKKPAASQGTAKLLRKQKAAE